MVMLDQDKKKVYLFLLILFSLFACKQEDNNKENLLKIKYDTAIYKSLVDSFKIWTINKLSSVEAEILYPYKVDSLICFNTNKTRLISCRHLYVNIPDATSDDLQYIYGEKIGQNWFFLKGPAIVIPREMIKGQDIHQPLSYIQMHQVALKEVYGGYLDADGKINENWFTNHFEDRGWGSINNQSYFDWCFKGKRYTNEKEFYQASHMCKVKSNWLNRDTTQPIKQLPAKDSLVP